MTFENKTWIESDKLEVCTCVCANCHHCGIENEVANEATAEVVQQETENAQEEAAAEEQSQDCKISHLLFSLKYPSPPLNCSPSLWGSVECQVEGRGRGITHG